ncbi:MAG: TMEM198/TM7SF3 family protein [Eubacteriales bacterium]|nr:TMEM198/TM7SF3 family protein [Eubacteriales bacterium]
MEQYIVEIIRMISMFKSLDAIPSFESLNSLNSLQPITTNYNLMMLISCVALGFGILNMVFGYRLLRFWMMLFGFIVGAGAGFLFAYISGMENHQTMIAIMIGTGVFCAVFSFLIYKAGIFIVGAGIGLSLGVYTIQPRTSLTFFLCILLGVGIGMLALKFSKGIIIIGTSILGGVTTGFSASWLANLEEYPYGIGMSLIFTLMAIAIQYAFNRGSDEKVVERAVEKPVEKESVEDGFREEDLERLRQRRSGVNYQTRQEKDNDPVYFDLSERETKRRPARPAKTSGKKSSGKYAGKEEIELFPVKRNNK